MNPMSRRELFSVAAAATLTQAATSQPAAEADPFTYSLNTSTIRGQNLSIVDKVNIAQRAGYQAIEPWIDELETHVRGGGTLRDLNRRIRDAGLRVDSSIGFAEWIVDDDARRRAGLESARRAMDMVVEIGGARLAAPPVGATNQNDLNLLRAAERYRALCEVGQQIGISPQVEVWGFSRSLARLGEAALIAMEANHPRACILADVYHLHKGGSGFANLKMLQGATMHVFHMNDYPAQPGPAEITDAHRVFPGDGVAPLAEMLRDLRRIGFRGTLSLELFNRDYWRQNPLDVARTGLEKMRAVVRSSMNG